MTQLQCFPNPADLAGDYLTGLKTVIPGPTQIRCSRDKITDHALSWIASDPPSNVLGLAQTDHVFAQYVAESSADYVKTFMKGKHNITRGVFLLACGHGSVRPVSS